MTIIFIFVRILLSGEVTFILKRGSGDKTREINPTHYEEQWLDKSIMQKMCSVIDRWIWLNVVGESEETYITIPPSWPTTGERELRSVGRQFRMK